MESLRVSFSQMSLPKPNDDDWVSRVLDYHQYVEESQTERDVARKHHENLLSPRFKSEREEFYDVYSMHDEEDRIDEFEREQEEWDSSEMFRKMEKLEDTMETLGITKNQELGLPD